MFEVTNFHTQICSFKALKKGEICIEVTLDHVKYLILSNTFTKHKKRLKFYIVISPDCFFEVLQSLTILWELKFSWRGGGGYTAAMYVEGRGLGIVSR